MNTDALSAALILRARAIEHHADCLCNALCAGNLVNADRHRSALMARLRAEPNLSDLIQALTQETDE